MGKRVLFGVLAGVFALGMKFYNKSTDSQELKSHLVSLCAGDSRCVQSVETNFEACFDQAYKLGGRRTPSHLESDEFVACMNNRGATYFRVKK
jgi:hypothetical protein